MSTSFFPKKKGDPLKIEPPFDIARICISAISGLPGNVQHFLADLLMPDFAMFFLEDLTLLVFAERWSGYAFYLYSMMDSQKVHLSSFPRRRE